MLKRLIIALLLVSALPMQAAASWYLVTQVTTGGGTIDSRNKVGQVVGDGAMYRSYTTSANIPVTVTAATGYNIRAVTVDGTAVTLGTNPLSITLPGSYSDKNVTASFVVGSMMVKAATTSGTVSPASVGNITYGYTLTSPLTFVFTPSVGYGISKVSGSPFTGDLTGTKAVSGTSPGWSVPGSVNQRATVTFPTGYIFLQDVNLLASSQNLTPSVDPILPQTAFCGSVVKLQAAPPHNVAAGATYLWQYVSGPADEKVLDPATGTSYLSIPKPDCPLTGANQLAASFTAPGTAGQYKFLFIVKNAYQDTNGAWRDLSTLATVSVFTSPAAAARNQCQFCHSANGIGTATLFDNWSSSGHKTNGVMCAKCHVGADQGGHPGPPPDCWGCHENIHSWQSQGLCLKCHDPHKPWPAAMNIFPHFGSFSTAQYITPNLAGVSCDNCHKQQSSTVGFAVYTANSEWAKSSHGNPRSTAYIGVGPYSEENLEAFDFKFLGTAGTTPSAMAANTNPATAASNDCVRCHTSTGFVNYVTPTDPNNPTSTTFTNVQPWGTAGDRSREMVSCPTCHTPTPFSATFGRRSVGVTINVAIPDNSIYPQGVIMVPVVADTAYFNYSSLATKKIRRYKALYSYDFAGYPVSPGDSNLCIACHSGRAAGDVIKQTTSGLPNNAPINCNTTPTITCRLGDGDQAAGTNKAFWQDVDFIDPHGGCTTNMLYPDNLRPGYEYRTGTVNSTQHAGIGYEGSTGTPQGPCVGCHMSERGSKHRFAAVSSASNGVIGKAAALCYNCHRLGGAFEFGTNLSVLQGKKDGYAAALSFIKSQLADRNIHYNRSVPPYFFTASGNPVRNWQNADVMGAAFNLRLLDSDNGWVHNGTYAKRILFDTIDYLDNGLLDNSVSSTVTASGLTTATKTLITGYITINGNRP